MTFCDDPGAPVSSSQQARGETTGADNRETFILTLGSATADATSGTSAAATLQPRSPGHREQVTVDNPPRSPAAQNNSERYAGHEVQSHDLRTFIDSHHIRELHAPIPRTTEQRKTLLDLVRNDPPLHQLVVDTMRFDMTDLLDSRLAELVLVLSAHEPPTPHYCRKS